MFISLQESDLNGRELESCDGLIQFLCWIFMPLRGEGRPHRDQIPARPGCTKQCLLQHLHLYKENTLAFTMFCWCQMQEWGKTAIYMVSRSFWTDADICSVMSKMNAQEGMVFFESVSVLFCGSDGPSIFATVAGVFCSFAALLV